MHRRHFVALLATATCWGAIACGPAPSPSASDSTTHLTTSDEAVELTISVAASVQDAMKDIQAAYEQTAPNVTITYNFGSSGSLAQQIAQGAPADVFLSASQKWMDDLDDKGEILAASRTDLLQNAMVLIVPVEAAAITGFKEFATDQVRKIAMGEPESVPAGSYAKEVLTSLNLFETIQPKLVFGKDVRQVLSYVETGNVDAGLVYATDAQLSDRVKAIATAPAESHSPIVYPVAIVQDSDDPDAAQAFVDFLSSETAVSIFQGYGFGMAE